LIFAQTPLEGSWKFSFTEEVHAAIFCGPGFKSARYPILARIVDYYADARFRHAELDSLFAEVSDLLLSIQCAPQMKHALIAFRDICELAQRSGDDLLSFAD
jgi:hypothetical protein